MNKLRHLRTREEVVDNFSFILFDRFHVAIELRLRVFLNQYEA